MTKSIKRNMDNNRAARHLSYTQLHTTAIFCNSTKINIFNNQLYHTPPLYNSKCLKNH